MRSLGLCLVITAAALPATALAQDEAPRTVEDYLCIFAGECPDEAAPEAAADIPPGTPRVSATRGFSLSAPDARRPAPRARSQRRAPRAAAPRPPAAAQGQRVNLRLSFELGSARLTRTAEAEARVFGQSLMLPQLAAMRFRIEGHTDSSGSRTGNLSLSQRRAEAVADFLVAMGVGRDRLDVQGYGPDQPLPGTPASAGANRRVEAVRVS